MSPKISERYLLEMLACQKNIFIYNHSKINVNKSID